MRFLKEYTAMMVDKGSSEEAPADDVSCCVKTVDKNYPGRQGRFNWSWSIQRHSDT